LVRWLDTALDSASALFSALSFPLKTAAPKHLLFSRCHRFGIRFDSHQRTPSHPKLRQAGALQDALGFWGPSRRQRFGFESKRSFRIESSVKQKPEKITMKGTKDMKGKDGKTAPKNRQQLHSAGDRF
jgi:hypothetical protein